MTPKQILDSFSETLMQDERILSPQERALLRNLIRHAGSASLEPSIHAAVNATIASAVGETVAQRAFSVLGNSIIERIAGLSSVSRSSEILGAAIYAGTPPSPVPPDTDGPGPPRPDAPVLPPSPPHQSPEGAAAYGSGTLRISAMAKSDPGHGRPIWLSKVAAQPRDVRRAGVLEDTEKATAKCVALDEFLAPQELQELMRFTLEHEADFSSSQVIPRSSEQSPINAQHRRSSVLMSLGRHRELMLARIRSTLPLVLSQLGMEEFSITNVEAQITASNDGDFFHCHSDDGHSKVASRRLTFVYFFHQEPCQFSGGELRIYDSTETGRDFHTIVPQQNQIVFFPCSVQHEITPVECHSRRFADSRFTLNGWLHK